MRKTVGLSVIAVAMFVAAGTGFAGSPAPKPIDTLTKWKKKVGKIAPEVPVRRVQGLCRCPGIVNGITGAIGFWAADIVTNIQGEDTLRATYFVPGYDPVTGETSPNTSGCSDGIPFVK